MPTPVIKWVGGKRSIAEQLVNMSPRDIHVFYEPFLGSGAFFFSLSRTSYTKAVISDSNKALIELYAAIRDAPQLLMSALDNLQQFVEDKEMYYRIRAEIPEECDPVGRAARFIYLNKTGYNGLYRVNRSGRFNVPFGRRATPPALYHRENLLSVSEHLQTAGLLYGDFGEIVSNAGPGDFVYMDPPYVPLTKTANFTGYTSSSFTELDQLRLAELVKALTKRGCRVLLSNSDTPLVRRLYAGFDMSVVYVPRRVNSDSGGRGPIAELAIRNYTNTWEIAGGRP